MMNTPIFEFVSAYQKRNALRLHMPGHKGLTQIGPEAYDITEIDGADVLYDAQGIICESEENASRLFGTGRTLYSAEGSSLCIRAMVYLAGMYARQTGRKPLIAAARNAHKVFMTAAALLDIDICWLYPTESGSVVSCRLDLEETERILRKEKPVALYVTSPDYLGNRADLRALSKICRENDVLLMVDNAHGAYLKFLPASRHPIDLGADLCCDSAHKTLPVLTGGAYLHLSAKAPEILRTHAENALSLFASTSPSYLILQALDQANRYLADGYGNKLADAALMLARARAQVQAHGYEMQGDEPLKWTIAPKSLGYHGEELAQKLQEKNIVVEFADPDFVVMMFTPEMTEEQIHSVVRELTRLPKRDAITERPPVLSRPLQRMPAREALFSMQETIPVEEALGRILAAASVTCPPAVPVVVCGEAIDESAIKCFQYYGIEKVMVVKETDC